MRDFGRRSFLAALLVAPLARLRSKDLQVGDVVRLKSVPWRTTDGRQSGVMEQNLPGRLIVYARHGATTDLTWVRDGKSDVLRGVATSALEHV